MKVTRLDLDGSGSPLGIVSKILKADPDLEIPVKIEDLARALDIGEIQTLSTDGFEGGLLTDEVRSFGAILVREGMHRHRRRFTIGHELGHFLIPTHKPIDGGQFLCSAQDMRRWSAGEQNRAARMEKEANEFSAAILIPPPHLRRFLSQWSDPDLNKMIAVHEHFDVSREAASRAYAKYHGEKIAIVITKNGKIARIYASDRMPRLAVRHGDMAPRCKGAFSAPSGTISALQYADAGLWIESTWGERLPNIYEQVLAQSNGFATIMLWCEQRGDDDEFDPDAEKTARQRMRDQEFARQQYR